MAQIGFFECSRCGQQFLPDGLPDARQEALPGSLRDAFPTVCPLDGAMLWVRYDLEKVRRLSSRDSPAQNQAQSGAQSAASLGIGRYRDLLPDSRMPLRLSVGWTPLLPIPGYRNLLIKDEGRNPLGTTEVRGLSLAVSMARGYGVGHVALAARATTATALAAIAASASITAHLVSPDLPSPALRATADLFGTAVTFRKGSLAECLGSVREAVAQQQRSNTPTADRWLDLASGREPFRLEGSKTVALEIAEQLGWRLPGAILHPAGDPLGVLATAKALAEMAALGWVEPGSLQPRLYAIAPHAVAPPEGSADEIQVLAARAIEASGGRMVSVDAAASLRCLRQMARSDGLLLSREGAAGLAAYHSLLHDNELNEGDLVVLIDPLDGVASLGQETSRALPTSLPVGGIITPV